MSNGTSLVITGGIGSGKSLVSAFLERLGYQILDADEAGHAVLEAPEVIGEVGRHWPGAVRSGVVDRRALGEVVFSDPTELARLEELVHPLIRERISDWLAGSGQNRAVEVSVLKMVDQAWGEVLMIDAPEECRLRRLARRGMNSDQASRRMALQPPRQRWLAVADFVVLNDGTGGELKARVEDLAGHLDRR